MAEQSQAAPWTDVLELRIQVRSGTGIVTHGQRGGNGHICIGNPEDSENILLGTELTAEGSYRPHENVQVAATLTDPTGKIVPPDVGVSQDANDGSWAVTYPLDVDGLYTLVVQLNDGNGVPLNITDKVQFTVKDVKQPGGGHTRGARRAQGSRRRNGTPVDRQRNATKPAE
jgi:hypothetical protein